MATSMMAPVKNGQLVNDKVSNQEDKKEEKKGTSGLGKEAFLQLLIAQMQYQDPLEPMDNTEYISQLATFSQLEATQNLEATMDKGMANSLVGKYVILDTDSGVVSGRVDYVMYEKGEILLAVNDGLYSIEDLDTVADSAYFEAFEMANMFSAMMAKLPSPGSVTAGDADSIKQARAVYDAMNTYQQGFVSEEDLKKLEELEKEIAAITGKPDGGEDADKPNDGEDVSKPEDDKELNDD